MDILLTIRYQSQSFDTDQNESNLLSFYISLLTISIDFQSSRVGVLLLLLLIAYCIKCLHCAIIKSNNENLIKTIYE